MRPLALLATSALLLHPLPVPAAEPLARTIERVVDRPAFAPAFWGIEVRSLASGRVLYARNAGKNFRPASTLKLVTTAAALDALGPDARFRTTVETTARLDGLGRILGDVYLVGRGDPNLSGRFAPDGNVRAPLEGLAEALRGAGVLQIEGRVVGHEGAFTGERRGADWGWEDLTWSYGAEVSALSFNDNAVELRLAPGELPGDPAMLEARPPSSYYSVDCQVTTTSPRVKRDLTLVRESGNRIRLRGSLPKGEIWEGRVALEDPARYATTVFAEVLEARGVRVGGGVATSSDPLPAESRVLAAHDSLPLAEALAVVNKESQNLHTELLLRVLGQRLKGEGSVAAGHEAIRAFLARIGVPAEAWGLQDGSGLSRSDLLSPHGLVALLVAMDRHPHAAAFRGSLAVMGVDGTLKHRLRATRAEGRVLAKTGTLRGANALAGYLTTLKGERLAFAIVVNNHTVPGRDAIVAIDDVVRGLVAR